MGNQGLSAIERKEIVWLDWAKAIGIWLVVLGHAIQSTCIDREVGRFCYDFIYAFHMPLFFLLSGYLFQKKVCNRAFLRSLLYALVIPYLLYSLCFFPLSFYIDVIKNGHSVLESLGRLFLGMMMGDGYETPYSYYLCLPCWFIICIIQLKLLFSIFPVCWKSMVLINSFAIIVIALLQHYKVDLYCNLDSTLLAIPFFSLGLFVKNINIIGGGKIYSVILSIFMLYLVYVALYLNGSAQMNGPGIGRNVLLYLMGGIAGSLSILFVCQFLGRSNLIRLISRNTLFIIFFHWLLLVFYSLLRKEIDIWSFMENDYLAVAFTVVFSFLLFVPIVFAIKLLLPHFPLLFGKYLKR